jgi:hypothetical protein
MWSKSQLVLLRYVERGVVVSALPIRVVVDAGAAVVLHLVAGSEIAWPTMDGRPTREVPLEERYLGAWGAERRTWEGAGLTIVARDGASYAVWVFTHDDGVFRGWYINLEQPWTRTERGFDTRDHTLDVVIDPDGSWRWKDEDELDAGVLQGHHLPEEAEAIRAEGERVLAEWPLPTGWEDWRPPVEWEAAPLPAGWDAL